MARIRTVKPDLFRHELLWAAEKETGLPLRLAFIGLWTCADRDGRFRWRPNVLKLDCLPFDDVDFSRVLDALATRGFLVRYASGGEEYGHIPTWRRHQHINNREKPSDLPNPNDADDKTPGKTSCSPRVDDACRTRQRNPQAEGEGEGKGNGNKKPPVGPPCGGRRAKRAPRLPDPIPDGLELENWHHWIEYRQTLKGSGLKPWTQRTIDRNAKKLAALPPNQQRAIVEYSLDNYRALYFDRLGGTHHANAETPHERFCRLNGIPPHPDSQGAPSLDSPVRDIRDAIDADFRRVHPGDVGKDH